MTAADGVFMRRPSADGCGMTNPVVGDRHGGPGAPWTAANAVSAAGYVELLAKGRLPLAYGTTASYAAGGTDTFPPRGADDVDSPTVYTDPEAAFQLLLAANPGAN